MYNIKRLLKHLCIVRLSPNKRGGLIRRIPMAEEKDKASAQGQINCVFLDSVFQ